MASGSFTNFDGVPNDDEPPTIEVQYFNDGIVPVIPQLHPETTQYGQSSSYQNLERLDMDLNPGFLLPSMYRGGSDAGSDNQSIASCPPSPATSSSYRGSFSPESQYIEDNFDQLSIENGSPVIPYNSHFPATHSPHEGPSFNAPGSPVSGYHSDFGYPVQNQNGLLHAHYQQTPFYQQTTQTVSSRSLPDYLTSASTQQEDYATNQVRRIASSSSMSSAGQVGPYTPNDDPNLTYFQRLPYNFDAAFRDFSGVPSMSQGGGGGSGSASPSSNSIDMHNIHEFIKDHSEVQAAPDAEELKRVIAAKSPGSRQLFKKSAKTSVSTPAGHLASVKRRKNPGRFLCTLKDCSATFTRKLGLDNHLKSHLGIMDQKCDFCQRSFSTSLGRHMKRCKQNPNRQEAPSMKEAK